MKVEFYFDISCPWCWIASRWLTEVAKHRDIDVIWQSFSLALKNNEIGPRWRKGATPHKPAHEIMRVVEAVRHEYGDQMAGKFYAKLGKRWHNGRQHSARVLIPSLRELNLPTSLTVASTDTKWDKTLQKSLDNAVKVVGEDIGVPTIIFSTHKTKSGFFGPVFAKLPDTHEGLKIWDAISVIATYPSFYELKRMRNAHADVRTVERLL